MSIKSVVLFVLCFTISSMSFAEVYFVKPGVSKVPWAYQKNPRRKANDLDNTNTNAASSTNSSPALSEKEEALLKAAKVEAEKATVEKTKAERAFSAILEKVESKKKKIETVSKSVINFQRWKTKEGLNVYYHQASTLPMVDVFVAFDAGSARDGKQYGLASMVSSAVSQGTEKLSANDIADDFARVGAIYSNWVSRDMAVFHLRSLTHPQFLSTAYNTYLSVLSKATFPEVAFTRLKANRLIEIKAGKQNPSSVSNNKFYEMLYKDKPYGHPSVGKEKTISYLKRIDLLTFYKRYYVSKNASIIIVGDIAKSKAEAMSNQLSEGMGAGLPVKSLELEAQSTQAVTQFVSFPSKQTHVKLGQVGIRYQDKAFFPLMLGNKILGGDQLTSLLGKKIRMENGLSYSVYSMFVPGLARGPFVISLQTKTQNAQKAVELTKQTLEKFISKGPSEKQLKEAKQNIIGHFPLGLDSNKKIATQLMLMAFYKLPDNYIDNYRNRVSKVTLNDVQSAFKAQINLKALTLVEVGQHATKEPQLGSKQEKG